MGFSIPNERSFAARALAGPTHGARDSDHAPARAAAVSPSTAMDAQARSSGGAPIIRRQI